MTRRARLDLGVAVALLLVAAGVGGLGLGGWLLVNGPHTAARATVRGTNKADDVPRKEPDPATHDDGVVRALTVQLDTRGTTQYLYVTHRHPGPPLDDVTLTVEVRGTDAVKTTTRPQWEADRALRVDMPASFANGRAVVLTGEATQAGRPLRIDATVAVEAAGTPLGGKKKKD